MKLTLVVSLACVVGGVVWVYTIGTLLGVLLVIGGTLGLGVAMLPTLIDQFAVFLSTGQIRRK